MALFRQLFLLLLLLFAAAPAAATVNVPAEASLQEVCDDCDADCPEEEEGGCESCVFCSCCGAVAAVALPTLPIPGEEPVEVADAREVITGPVAVPRSGVPPGIFKPPRHH